MTGLSFDLTEEQERLRQTVRDFAERECPKDVARRLEASKAFPEDLDARIMLVSPDGAGQLATAFPALAAAKAPRLTRPAAPA